MKIKLLLIFCLFPFLVSCAPVAETGKILWGTSIRHLEKVRPEAISKTYACKVDECYSDVLSLGYKDGQETPADQVIPFKIFQENRLKRFIVFMNVPGYVDTTEIGVFFTPNAADNEVKIEVTSLSSYAKRKAAEIIFQKLDSRFNPVIVP